MLERNLQGIVELLISPGDNMPEEIFPRKFAYAVKQGFERVSRYRKLRAMLIRAYVGTLYASEKGLTGDEPINLIFNAIRSTVPNLIQKHGANKIETEIIEYRDYAFLLSKALDVIDKRIKLKDILRYNVVDAMFGLGILKSGLARGGNILNFGDMLIDEGQVFTDNVDLDDLTIDPTCTSFRKPAFVGDGTRVPRQILLDDDSFDHDAVIALPRSSHADARRRADALTKARISQVEMDELQDHVDVVELFVPGANTKIVMADPRQKIMNNYLSIKDFYGPSDGPYTFTALTQPVPGNPFPVAPVGIWYDLHNIANEMAVKIFEQAKRQKDLIVADPAYVDEAEDMRTASDGEILIGNPDGVKPVSIGGQNPGNEVILQSLHGWFNYMANNPDQLAGISLGAKTATGQSILQSNASVILEDTRDMAEDAQAEINRKMGWYLHTDPLMDMLLAHRKPGGEHIQLRLTPEQRRGDFLDFTFTTKRRSLVHIDPVIRSRRVIEFGTKVIPSIIMSAVSASQIGLPFNVQRALTDIAEEQGILEEVYDWLHDPEFMQRMALMQAMGPQNQGKAGSGGGMSPAGIMQNGGNPLMPNISNMAKEERQNQQMGANDMQSNIQGVY